MIELPTPSKNNRVHSPLEEPAKADNQQPNHLAQWWPEPGPGSFDVVGRRAGRRVPASGSEHWALNLEP